MVARVERALFAFAGQADHLRALALRITMGIPALRAAFCHRALRLAVLFCLSSAAMLGLSLLFPLWVLAVGPAVYGVPHLVASLRYFHYSAAGSAKVDGRVRRRAFAVLGLIMAAVACCRLTMPMTGLSEWRGSNYTELVGTGMALVAGVVLYRKGIRGLLKGALLLAPLAYFFERDPGTTVGALVLLHNAVAFVYWWLAAKSRAEKAVAIGGLGVLIGVTALIFAGRLDALGGAGRGVPESELAFAGLSFESLGAMITPWSEEPSLWRHAAVAYAFGQALHYFVWLKAIPDQHHRNEIPTSFRQSLSLLQADFGRNWTLLIALILALSLASWLVLSFARARWVYFCLAAFHGYFELAGLALVLGGGLRLPGLLPTRRKRPA